MLISIPYFAFFAPLCSVILNILAQNYLEKNCLVVRISSVTIFKIYYISKQHCQYKLGKFVFFYLSWSWITKSKDVIVPYMTKQPKNQSHVFFCFFYFVVYIPRKIFVLIFYFCLFDYKM